jgi:hypothetical protein
VSGTRTEEDRQAQGADGFVFPSLPADEAAVADRAEGDGPATPARAA